MEIVFKKSLSGFLILGLLSGLIGYLIGRLENNLFDNLGFGLFLGLFTGLIFGILGGFTDKIRKDKVSPNQGIKLSIKNSFFVFIITVLIFVLIGGLIGGGGLKTLLIGGLKTGLVLGLIAGLLGGLNRGLSAVIKHYVLRLVLWLSGKIPFKFIPFLDYCAKLILLKKVGGGYFFIHRMLLEYFAKL